MSASQPRRRFLATFLALAAGTGAIAAPAIAAPQPSARRCRLWDGSMATIVRENLNIDGNGPGSWVLVCCHDWPARVLGPAKEALVHRANLVELP